MEGQTIPVVFVYEFHMYTYHHFLGAVENLMYDIVKVLLGLFFNPYFLLV